jgi:hypothetical protein
MERNVRPNFELKPGQEFLEVGKMLMLEDLTGWLSNADAEMRANSICQKYVFIDNDGNLSPHNALINQTIQYIGRANQAKKELLELLNKK